MADPSEGGGATEPTTDAATLAGPDGGGADSGADVRTTAGDVGTSAAADAAGTASEEFFDPKALPEELLPAYKQMQRAFTQKTQGIRESRNKIEAYDAFMRDPVSTLQNIANQYGLHLSPAQAAAAVAQASDDEQPDTWNDVYTRAAQHARAQILQELSPVLNEVRQIKKSSIEKVLDEEAPEWRIHEDAMIETLNKHPSLANDPTMLARVALPREVVEGRAMQQALRKLESKGKSAKASGGSTTGREPAPDPNRKMSFQEAVDFARAQVAKDVA